MNMLLSNLSIYIYLYFFQIRPRSLTYNLANVMNAIILEAITFWTVCICLSLFVIEKVAAKIFGVVWKIDHSIPFEILVSVAVSRRLFSIRFARADDGNCTSFKYTCRFLLFGPGVSFEFVESKFCHLSIKLVSISAQRPTFRFAHDDTIATAFLSECLWDHAT